MHENGQSRQGEAPLETPPCQVNRCSAAKALNAYTQRESRMGSAAVRVAHSPVGVIYFSPTTVCAIKLHPVVNAICSTVDPAARARSE